MLGGLGDFFQDLFKNAENVIDKVTGGQANREAQARAVELARIQADASTSQAQASAATWQKITPWLAIGGAAVGLGVLYLMLKK